MRHLQLLFTTVCVPTLVFVFLFTSLHYKLSYSVVGFSTWGIRRNTRGVQPVSTGSDRLRGAYGVYIMTVTWTARQAKDWFNIHTLL